MAKFGSVEEILDFAIRNEEQANKFYLDLAKKVDDPALKETLTGFAAEEAGHKKRLEKIKAGGHFETTGKTADLKMAEYVVSGEPTKDMSYKDILVLAMKKEKAAFRLYMDLADMTADKALKGVLLMLAQEEAKHKLRFEIEYDEVVMKED